MRPAEILDRQGDLITRLTDDTFRQGLSSIVQGEVWTRQSKTYRVTDEGKAEQEATGLLHMDLLKNHVQAASAYRVTEDMCDLLDLAAAGLEPEDKWDRTLAPTGCGIVRFDKPIPLGGMLTADGPEVDLWASWLVWGPGPLLSDHKPRMFLWWLGTGNEKTDAFTARLLLEGIDKERVRQIMGPWSMLGWDTFPDGLSLGDKVLPLGDHGLDTDDPSFNEQRKKMALALAHPEGNEGELWQSNDARLAHALFLLLNQTVTVLVDEPIDRAARRRAGKMRIPARVTTIALRRAANTTEREPGESHVEWQHRWLSRSHWGWRHCKADKPGAVPYKGGWGVRVWVAASIKGPEGAPLKVTDKLYDLRR